MTDYLRPKLGGQRVRGQRRMQEGIFRNPPEYTVWGGFTSARKFTDPSGHRDRIGGPSLERGGPSAQRGKPV